MESRSREPLSQANEGAVNDQEIITVDIITEETPAGDMELNKDSIRSDDTTAVKVQETITEQMETQQKTWNSDKMATVKTQLVVAHISMSLLLTIKIILRGKLEKKQQPPLKLKKCFQELKSSGSR